MSNTDETQPAGDTTDTSQEAPKDPPKWEQRSDFAINGKMKEVIHLALDATQAQIALYRRKIEKLTYGS